MTFRILVPRALYKDIAHACGEDYANSYLHDAEIHGKADLWPRTVTAWERLHGRREAMEVIERHGLKLRKPEPFGSPFGHPSGRPD